jgi:hypothetical protein
MSTKCNLVPAIVVLSLATAGCHPASSPAGDLLEIPAQLGPDGALRFASVDDFFDAADAIRNKSPAQLDRWERGLGFLSMRRAFAELEERLGAATGDQRTALLDANADLLAPGSTVDELARRIPATAYAAFVDRRGVLYVADVAHKVTETQVLTARAGNLDTIDAWLVRKPGTAPGAVRDGLVDAFNYVVSNATQGCSTPMSGTTTAGDRRETYTAFPVILSMDSPGDHRYQYTFEWHLGAQKKNLFGNWVSYQTTFQTYNSAVSIDAFTVIDSSTPDYLYQYDRYSLAFEDLVSPEANAVHLAADIGDEVRSTTPIPFGSLSFYTLHFETTTRGTFPTRGILDRRGCCGDSSCQLSLGESESSCAADCTRCPSGVCSALENASTCYSDCHCGDGICDPAIEDANSCQPDCGPPPGCFIEPC